MRTPSKPDLVGSKRLGQDIAKYNLVKHMTVCLFSLLIGQVKRFGCIHEYSRHVRQPYYSLKSTSRVCFCMLCVYCVPTCTSNNICLLGSILNLHNGRYRLIKLDLSTFVQSQMFLQGGTSMETLDKCQMIIMQSLLFSQPKRSK